MFHWLCWLHWFFCGIEARNTQRTGCVNGFDRPLLALMGDYWLKLVAEQLGRGSGMTLAYHPIHCKYAF